MRKPLWIQRKKFRKQIQRPAHEHGPGLADSGQGAGKLPTACAVVGDLIDLDRRRHLSPFTTNGAPIAIDNAQVGHRYYVRTAARLGIPAEKIDDRAYLTEPVSVARMHAHAEELRVSDPGAFFAGMRDE